MAGPTAHRAAPEAAQKSKASCDTRYTCRLLLAVGLLLLEAKQAHVLSEHKVHAFSVRRVGAGSEGNGECVGDCVEEKRGAKVTSFGMGAGQHAFFHERSSFCFLFADSSSCSYRAAAEISSDAMKEQWGHLSLMPWAAPGGTRWAKLSELPKLHRFAAFTFSASNQSSRFASQYPLYSEEALSLQLHSPPQHHHRPLSASCRLHHRMQCTELKSTPRSLNYRPFSLSARARCAC
eukprot:6208859-Pleurochrysis_carterae.AAC.1